MSVTAPPLFGDPTASVVFDQPARGFASFWRRLGAFFLDVLMVGVTVFIVTIPFFGPLSRLGAYGRVVGLLIALPYFAILNSKIGNGQTLGKRVLHIQVVNEDGATLPFAKSLVRYFVLAIPYFLDDAVVPATKTPAIVSYVMSALGVVSAATLYFMIFNRHTRQGMHDLAAGSFVVSSDLCGALKKEPIWKPHWAIFGSIVAIFFFGGWLLGRKITTWGAYSQMMEDAWLVERMDGVQAAGIKQQWSSTFGQEGTKKALVVTVQWVGDASNQEAAADTIAKTILTHDSAVQTNDTLRIILVRGYDLGITHATSSISFAHSPEEWRARLFHVTNQPSPPKL